MVEKILDFAIGKLFDLLKIVLEKYLISTVGTVTSTFIIYYITPSNNKLLVKFTEIGYIVFFGFICFLIIEFARFIIIVLIRI